MLVTALTHGNEICGAIALDRLFRAGLRPRQGKLTLAFDNVAAYRSFNPRHPVASRFVDEDFNRLWDEATLDGARQSTELARARALRPFVDAADYLLDIHSMQHATAPLMLAGTLDRSVALARRVGIPELIMCDAGHAAGKRMRDYGAFGDPASAKTALLIEAGQHWQQRTAEVATDVMLRFLVALGALARDDAAPLGGPDFDTRPTPAGHRGHRGGDDHRRPVRIRRRLPRARSADPKGHSDRPRRRAARCAPPMTIAS